MLVSLVSFMSAVARTGALFNVIPILAQERLSLTTGRIGFGLGGRSGRISGGAEIMIEFDVIGSFGSDSPAGTPA